MVQKEVRGGICYSIKRYAKAKKKYMKDYDKNKESSYVKYWDLNNLHGLAMSQKLSVNAFEWVEDSSQCNKDFRKNYNGESDEGCFFEVNVQYPEKLHLPEQIKTEKL